MAVNQDMARHVLAAIEASPEHYDQAQFLAGEIVAGMPACGTTMCIAGWTNFLTGNHPMYLTLARDSLGLSAEEGQYLFFEYDNEAAMARLRHMAEHGKYPPIGEVD